MLQRSKSSSLPAATSRSTLKRSLSAPAILPAGSHAKPVPLQTLEQAASALTAANSRRRKRAAEEASSPSDIKKTRLPSQDAPEPNTEPLRQRRKREIGDLMAWQEKRKKRDDRKLEARTWIDNWRAIRKNSASSAAEFKEQLNAAISHLDTQLLIEVLKQIVSAHTAREGPYITVNRDFDLALPLAKHALERAAAEGPDSFSHFVSVMKGLNGPAPRDHGPAGELARRFPDALIATIAARYPQCMPEVFDLLELRKESIGWKLIRQLDLAVFLKNQDRISISPEYVSSDEDKALFEQFCRDLLSAAAKQEPDDQESVDAQYARCIEKLLAVHDDKIAPPDILLEGCWAHRDRMNLESLFHLVRKDPDSAELIAYCASRVAQLPADDHESAQFTIYRLRKLKNYQQPLYEPLWNALAKNAIDCTDLDMKIRCCREFGKGPDRPQCLVRSNALATLEDQLVVTVAAMPKGHAKTMVLNELSRMDRKFDLRFEAMREAAEVKAAVAAGNKPLVNYHARKVLL